MSVLLSASGGIYHWNIKERVPVKKFASTDRGIISASTSHDGKDVAVSEAGGLTIVSLITDTQRKLKGVKNARHVAYSHDSKTLFYSTKKSDEYVVQSYSLTADRHETTFHTHRSEITSLSVSPDTSFVLSTSATPPRVLILNNIHSKSSSLAIDTPLKFTAFHPTRPQFLAITTVGDLTCHNTSSKRSSRTFQIRATTAIWWNNNVVAACEDLSVKCISFEEKNILWEFQIGAPATSIFISDSTIFVGLKTGRCEAYTISEGRKCKKIGECQVGHGAGPILNVQGASTSITSGKSRPNSQIENIPRTVTSELTTLKHHDVLDIFSPLKRKESEIEIASERREKRLKEVTTNLDKSTRDINKRFSTVINADGKREKSTSHSTKRDDIRMKEREMEKESMKALTQKIVSQPGKSVPLQTSSKDNVSYEKPHVKSPRKSILKATMRDIVSVDLKAASPSPRRRISRRDSIDAVHLPDLEKESPMTTIRRKSKSPERRKSIGSSTNLIRSVSPLPDKPKKSEVDGDLWSNIVQPVQSTTLQAVLVEKTVHSPKNPQSPMKKTADTTSELPADLGSAVLEIQTVLRRDIERLRLDMVRQFVSFRNEMGQKWEGEVDQLRQENEILKNELNILKREQEMKSKERGNWQLY